MNDEFQVAIERIKKINPEVLKREGRDYEFTDIYPLIKRLFNSIESLGRHEEFLVELPENRKQDLLNHLNQFAEILERVSSFSPQVDNPQAQRDNLANDTKNIYNALFDRLIQPIDLHSVKERSSSSGVTRISKKAESQLSEIQNLKKQIEGLLESSKKATASIGLGIFSDVFEVQAKEHRESSKFWLGTSVIALAILSLYLYELTIETISNLRMSIDSINSIAIFLAKLFPVSIAFYVVRQTMKNYNVNMHLYTVNKHKSNILKAFEAIVRPSDDAKARDTILTQAAKAIFYSGDTGYLPKSSSKEDLDLVQIIVDNFKK